ncbi:MAG: hypothetical protein AB7E85_06795 [Pseudobdellovibrionaceae bacterium]
MKKDAFRLLAFISIGANVFLGIASFFFIYAYFDNMNSVELSAPFCVGNERDFDSIRAAQMIGRLDIVSLILTTGGIILAISAFFGFWVIRREVIAEAREEAGNAARDIANRYFQEGNGQSLNFGDSDKHKQYNVSGATISKKTSISPSDVSIANAQELGDE